MKKFSYFILALLFTACVGFQNATLTPELPLAHFDSATMNAPTIPVLQYKSGVFFGPGADISKITPSHGNMTVGKSGASLVVDLKNVGVDWEEITIKFPALNFSDAPFLLVKTRVDLNSKDSVKMRIDLVDEDGIISNYSPQEKYIRSKKESKVYKFIYAGNWEQGWPTRAKVDAKRIVAMKINFNGGGPNYSGKLYIDEIIAFDGKKKQANPNNYALFDFSDGTSGWWSANNIEIVGEEVDGNDVMKMNFDEAGPGWEGFGYKFDKPVDFGKTPIMKIRMKADAPGNLRIDLRDSKEYATNFQPSIYEFKASEEYFDMIFDYSERFNQSWPNNQVVDSTQITSISCFINPADFPAFTGNVLIDDIYLMSAEEFATYKNK